MGKDETPTFVWRWNKWLNKWAYTQSFWDQSLFHGDVFRSKYFRSHKNELLTSYCHNLKKERTKVISCSWKTVRIFNLKCKDIPTSKVFLAPITRHRFCNSWISSALLRIPALFNWSVNCVRKLIAPLFTWVAYNELITIEYDRLLNWKQQNVNEFEIRLC
jgi:hypothetical protein